MRTLWPPLAIIQADLFGPSEELVAQWAEAPASLPTDVRVALESDSQAQERLATWRQTDDVPLVDMEQLNKPLPSPLRDLIRRRVASRRVTFSPIPTQGQILRVDTAGGPTGPFADRNLARPLAVLIFEPSGKENVWSGWMVASEVDYASYWDMVLEPEDEPFDPLAGMIQIWNPVDVYVPATSTVLAELKPKRLQAVRALALECVTTRDLDPHEANPGWIAPRPVGEFQILTGTPISGPRDPRWHFQELYHEAAEAVRQPARLAKSHQEDRLAPPLSAPWRYPAQKISAVARPLSTVLEWLRHLFLRRVPAWSMAMAFLAALSLAFIAQQIAPSRHTLDGLITTHTVATSFPTHTERELIDSLDEILEQHPLTKEQRKTIKKLKALTSTRTVAPLETFPKNTLPVPPAAKLPAFEIIKQAEDLLRRGRAEEAKLLLHQYLEENSGNLDKEQ